MRADVEVAWLVRLGVGRSAAPRSVVGGGAVGERCVAAGELEVGGWRRVGCVPPPGER